MIFTSTRLLSALASIEKRAETSFPVDLKGWSKQLALHLTIAFVKKKDAKLFAEKNSTLATAQSLKFLPPKNKLKRRPISFVTSDLALSMHNVGIKPDAELLSYKKGERSTLSYKHQLEMAKRIMKAIGPDIRSILNPD